MSKCRLLVIDDEPGFRHFVRYVAEGFDCEVCVAANAEDFKQSFVSFKPTAIILDFVMPDVEGVESLQHLAHVGCQARILVVSGYHPDYPRLAEAVAGSCGLTAVKALVKPVDAAGLHAPLADPSD